MTDQKKYYYQVTAWINGVRKRCRKIKDEKIKLKEFDFKTPSSPDFNSLRQTIELECKNLVKSHFCEFKIISHVYCFCEKIEVEKLENFEMVISYPFDSSNFKFVVEV